MKEHNRPKPELINYVLNSRKSGFSEPAIKKGLKDAGWPEDVIKNLYEFFDEKSEVVPNLPDEPKKKKIAHKKEKPAKSHTKKIIVISLFVIFLFILILGSVAGYFYFFVVSPTFVDEPTEQSPSLPEEISGMLESNDTNIIDSITITPEHVTYLINKMDGYKVHEDPINKEPAQIETLIIDTKQTFSSTKEGKEIISANTKASLPDIRIHIDKKTALTLLTSTNPKEDIADLITSEKIWIESLKDEQTLALKGYKAIYDAIKIE